MQRFYISRSIAFEPSERVLVRRLDLTTLGSSLPFSSHGVKYMDYRCVSDFDAVCEWACCYAAMNGGLNAAPVRCWRA